MKYFRCSIKGDVSAEDCYHCYVAQNNKLAGSRVVCKMDHVISIEPTEQSVDSESSESSSTIDSTPSSVFNL